MASDLDDLNDPERWLCEVLAAYFEAVEAGKAPERGAWLARYPDLADQLAAFFEQQDRLLRMTGPLRTITEATGRVGSRTVEPFPAGKETGPGREGTGMYSLGDYELEGEIARGGMGVVYKARQISLDRPVALKVLPGGPLANQDDLRRFHMEAAAIAILDHPNIVPIYEVGEHEGLSYFAMKLIEGNSLAQRLPGSVADPRAAARLVATIARAVHHAHQRGVLHRDLKPSNIVIDADGQPHVTDFGLAKRVEGNCELTQSGAVLGTPSYMAPEQASGNRRAITTATDIYGLGAVLYALLTGKPPFKGDSVLETLEQVKQQPPDPPSGLGRDVDRDLETVCLKCLEKEPERRYASALALAEDLERLLRGEPIAARPAGRLGRAWRWCRHNPMLAGFVTTTSLLLVVLFVGALVSTFLIWEARNRTQKALDLEQAQRRIAEASATATQEGRSRARRRSERAISQVNELLYELMSSRWSSMPGISELRARIAQKTIRSLEGYVEESRDDPTVTIELAIVYAQISGIQDSIGAYPESRQAARQILAIQESRLATTPDQTGLLLNVATTHWGIGNSFFAEGKQAEAVPPYREAVSVFEHCLRLQPDHRAVANQLAWLLATCPSIEVREPARAVELARTATEQLPKSPAVWNTLGVAQLRSGDSQQALATLEKAMAMKRGGDSFDWFFVAMAYSDLGRSDQARAWYDRAVDWRLKESPEHLELRLFHDEAAAKLGLARPIHDEISIHRDIASGRSTPGRSVP
jgi:tetratricopeptide (TPR) repeat protein/predicted Ser/Thr protein kinase